MADNTLTASTAPMAAILETANPPAAHLEIQLWIYRILFQLGTYKIFVREKDFMNDELATMLGFGELIHGTPNAPAFDRGQIIAEMRRQWQALEGTSSEQLARSSSSQAIYRFAQRLGLAEIEIDILVFRIALSRNRALCNAAELSYRGSDPTINAVVDVLSAVLGRDADSIQQSLSPSGTLISSGILELRLGRPGPFHHVIDILSCITEEISFEHSDPLMYFRSRLVRAEPARLSSDDYSHVAQDIEIVSQYLTDARKSQRSGVNVLIYGRPGTGKSEFTRMMAAKLGWDLIEVASCQRDGTVMDGSQRFRAYRLGQSLLSKSENTLVVFDEIEDVFRVADRNPENGANLSQQKAWVNRIFESNPVPAFWITNNTDCMDEAFLRRFDYVLELDVPPRSVRSRVLDRYLSGLPVSNGWKKKMMEHEYLAPAVIERAAKVVRSLKDVNESTEIERTLSRVLGNTLEVMRLPREPRNWQSSGRYRLDVLNTDCDMEQLREGLVAHRQGRICLYGPPGTGKTAFGRYLSEVLDRPLLVRRASDIVSPWVGVTEKNMARMFRQGVEEEAILLLDEADSFLMDRQGAQRSWEITGVNEMLTQIESYEGIFIASTNLMTTLDPAALRRFDLKIRFDYIKAEQAWLMFEEARAQLGITDGADLSASVAKLGLVTPGDFANVIRQSRLRPIQSGMALLQRLRAECEIKPEGQRRSIGFAA